MNQRGDDGLETKNNSLLRKKKTNTIRSRADEFHESCNTELLRLSLSLGLSEEREKRKHVVLSYRPSYTLARRFFSGCKQRIVITEWGDNQTSFGLIAMRIGPVASGLLPSLTHH